VSYESTQRGTCGLISVDVETLEDLFRNLPKFKNDTLRIISLIPEWSRAYAVPESAIIHQLAYAHGWILTNPKKAPKKDVVRFLFNWMRAAQKHGNLRPPPAKRAVPVLEPGPELSDNDLREMHDQKVKALGRCRTQDCSFCPKVTEEVAGGS
jgi:hypothetical protein